MRKLKITFLVSLSILLFGAVMNQHAMVIGAENDEPSINSSETKLQPNIREGDQFPSQDPEGAFWYNGIKEIEDGEFADRTRVYEDNTLDPRSFFIPYSNSESALSHDKNESTKYQSLNGQWKFKLKNTPLEVIEDFHEKDYDISSWKNITVPASWQMEGFDIPVYADEYYPWGQPTRGKGTPNIEYVDYENIENATPPLNYNPVGHYAMDFNVDEDMKSDNVILNFQGVESAFYVYVNGEYVGYSEDSFAQHEFDITDEVNVDGENRLAVLVYRWSDASLLENADMIRLSGIFRDVSLMGRSKSVQLEDYHSDVSFDENYNNATVNINADLIGDQVENAEVRAKIIDGDKVVDESTVKNKDGNVDLNLEVKNAKHWNNEHPYLYDILIEVLNDNDEVTETVARKIGMREVEMIKMPNGKNVYALNGEKILFKGVNRHEISKDTARTISEEEIIKDFKLMRQNNVNAVRTSHYPNSVRFYELADKYGMLVVDEANLESHQGGTWIPKDVEDFRYPSLHRMKNVVERDKNFTSVISWSLGNEAVYGTKPAVDDKYAFKIMHDYVKSVDSKRPIIFEPDSREGIADIRTGMYRPVETDKSRLESDDKRPYLQVEYSHAMGNSLGYYKEYWDLWRQHDHSMGGFIWDWVDQSPLWDIPNTFFTKDLVSDKEYELEGKILEDKNALFGSAIFDEESADFNGEDQTFTLYTKFDPLHTDGVQSLMNHGDKQYQVNIEWDELVFAVYDGNSWDEISVNIKDKLTDDFNDLAVSYDSGKVKIFFNGEQIHEDTTKTLINNQEGSNFVIGKDLEADRYFSGSFQELAVFNDVVDFNDNASKVISNHKESLTLHTNFEQNNTRSELIAPGITFGENGDKYFAYGGDFGIDKINNDDNFLNNGIVNPLREPKSQAQQMKYIQQDIQFNDFDLEERTVDITNEFAYTNLSDYDFTYSIEKNGQVIEEKKLDVELAPRETKEFNLDFDTEISNDDQYYLNVIVKTTDDKIWADKGHVSAFDQFKLNEVEKEEIAIPKQTVNKEENKNELILSSDQFSLVFNKETGLIDSYKFEGTEYLSDSMRPNYFRAPVDNDRENGWVNRTERWQNALENKDSVSIEVTDTNPIKVIVESELNNGSKVKEVYTVLENGKLKVYQNFEPSTGSEIPTVGHMIPLKDEFKNLAWYGRGFEDNYEDRSEGYPVGTYNTVIDDKIQGIFTKPTEAGNKQDVHWAALSNENGKGVYVKSDTQLLDIGADKYDPIDITNSKHPYELTQTDTTYLRVAMKTAGLGGMNSWGATPVDTAQIFPNQNYEFSFDIIPFADRNMDKFSEMYKTHDVVDGEVNAVYLDGEKYVYFDSDLLEYNGITASKIEVELSDDSIYAEHIVENDVWTIKIRDHDDNEIKHYTFNLDLQENLDLSEGVKANAIHQEGENPENAIDGNTSTIWHSPWAGDKFPIDFTLTFDEIQSFNALTYTPRQDNSYNGVILKAEIIDGVKDKVIKTIEWKKDKNPKTIQFDEEISTKEVTIRILNAATDSDDIGKSFGSAAEIELFAERELEIPQSEVSSASDLINLVEEYKEDGDVSNSDVARALKRHLIAVERYENVDKSEKVVKHMKAFKVLLEYYQENNRLSEKAYSNLIEGTEAVINMWK